MESLETDILKHIQDNGPCDAEELWDDVFRARLEAENADFWNIVDNLTNKGFIEGYAVGDEIDTTVYLKAVKSSDSL